MGGFDGIPATMRFCVVACLPTELCPVWLGPPPGVAAGAHAVARSMRQRSITAAGVRATCKQPPSGDHVGLSSLLGERTEADDLRSGAVLIGMGRTPPTDVSA